MLICKRCEWFLLTCLFLINNYPQTITHPIPYLKESDSPTLDFNIFIYKSQTHTYAMYS